MNAPPSQLLWGSSVSRDQVEQYIKTVIDSTNNLQGVDRYRAISNHVHTALKKITQRPTRNMIMCEYTKQILDLHPWSEIRLWILPTMNRLASHAKSYIARDLRMEMFDILQEKLTPEEFKEVRTEIDLGWTVPSEYTATQRPFASSLKVAFGYKGIIHLAKEVVHENIDRQTLDTWIQITIDRKSSSRQLYEMPLLLIALNRADAIGDCIIESKSFAFEVLYAYLDMTYADAKKIDSPLERLEVEKIQKAIRRYVDKKFPEKTSMEIAHALGQHAGINSQQVQQLVNQIQMFLALDIEPQKIMSVIKDSRSKITHQLEFEDPSI